MSRNFCDNNGMITRSRHNDLVFETDRRGLLVCVDSVRNVLGVCCVELAVMLSGAGRPLRQDDVFSLSQELFINDVTHINKKIY